MLRLKLIGYAIMTLLYTLVMTEEEMLTIEQQVEGD